MKLKKDDVKNSSSFTKLLGVDLFNVIAINPSSLEEINTITGKNFTKEPEYLSVDENGIKQLRIDFYVKSKTDNYIDRVSIFLSEKLVISKSENPQWINEYGQFVYCLNPLELSEDRKKFFSTEVNFRQSFTGEENLYSFLTAWFNVSNYYIATKIKHNILLDTPFLELLDGNFSEFSLLLEEWKENDILLVRGVSDDSYQRIYNRREGFNSPFRKNFDYLKEQLSKYPWGNVDPNDVAKLIPFGSNGHLTEAKESVDISSNEDSTANNSEDFLSSLDGENEHYNPLL